MKQLTRLYLDENTKMTSQGVVEFPRANAECGLGNRQRMRPADADSKTQFLVMDYSTFEVHYRDLKTWFHKQEARNLPLHEAQPSAVLNIEFSVRERVLVNCNNTPTKSALTVRQHFKQLEGKKS